MEDGSLLVEHYTNIHLQKIKLVHDTWAVLHCLKICIWGHPEDQIFITGNSGSTKFWAVLLVSNCGLTTLQRFTTVLVFFSRNMNAMQINTHSETLANPPVPVGESIIY
jgi:hypothetical protein